MFNKVILVGNLGKDPELKYTQTGRAVCNFNLAVNERWTDQNGDRQEKTVWVRVAAWGALGENCAQYLSKGRQVLVEGRLDDPGAWIGDDKEAHAQNQVTALNVKFLGKRVEQEEEASPSHDDEAPF